MFRGLRSISKYNPGCKNNNYYKILLEYKLALEEYKKALNFFNVVNQDQIDEAIYLLKLSEEKVNRLYKKLKEFNKNIMEVGNHDE